MTRGEGRNYALAFGQLITYRDEKDDTGQSVRRIIDGGENPPQGALVFLHAAGRRRGHLPDNARRRWQRDPLLRSETGGD